MKMVGWGQATYGCISFLVLVLRRHTLKSCRVGENLVQTWKPNGVCGESWLHLMIEEEKWKNSCNYWFVSFKGQSGTNRQMYFYVH